VLRELILLLKEFLKVRENSLLKTNVGECMNSSKQHCENMFSNKNGSRIGITKRPTEHSASRENKDTTARRAPLHQDRFIHCRRDNFSLKPRGRANTASDPLVALYAVRLCISIESNLPARYPTPS
jgi:hypothetical protein